MRYLLPLLILLVACQSEKPPGASQLTPAFYHWKATFDPAKSDRAALDSLGVRTLYIRFFDVDWDAVTRQAVPKATVVFRAKPTGVVVPVVYITNRTMLNLPPANVPDLAQKLSMKIRQLADKQGVEFAQVQIDCDWTRSTRGTYFALLRAISRKMAVPLSATIRLHQVKFAAQTGVPPVGRGMLMAYNTGDWKRPATRNSILDLAELKQYTDYLPGYPLPLDVALPLFRWAVVYRNGHFLTLLNNIDRAQVRAVPGLRGQTDSTRFVADHDTVVLGVALRRGDLLRTEACSVADLQAAKAILLAQLPDQNRIFAIYHLDSTVLHAYPYANLKTLVNTP